MVKDLRIGIRPSHPPNVEKQYKEGIAKMSSLYQADGDKKSRADAEMKRVESDKKIALLQTALKRYKNLHILDEADDDDIEDDAGDSSSSERYVPDSEDEEEWRWSDLRSLAGGYERN